MERIYDAKRCPVENRLAYTEYLLAGEAVHWWSNMKMMLEDSQETITWELFKKKFYAEYFPDSVRYAKEVEFLQLMQGDMSVSEYADKFKHLGIFHTLKMTEDWQCRKFENGLRGDLKLMVAPLSIKEFPALVEKARVMEKLKAEGAHLRSACPQLSNRRTCHRCGQVGHFIKDCPVDRSTVSRPSPQPQSQPSRGGARPQAAGRVYVVTGAEVAGSGNLIIESCVIAGRSLHVLFDSGSTHSFVSESRVVELGLPAKELQYDLVVSTPASGLVRTSTVCARCKIEVEGANVILGMDWLSANHILIDCNERKVLFPSLEDEDLLMSSQQVDKAVKEGTQCFLILTQLSIETEIGPLEAPIVGDFSYVFPEDVPGLPPYREI
ncbi:uncharacterized protein LOC114174373 [Vigna unguiculata]|uniref:uncharacterized protein LOC114174373 n=1 Tax=Vigna unguiculata TaxID=3917 RepID=UPI0010163E1F|nr:uncharacterized protein LOC114174373 [Vigna unguiculata]